MSKQFLGVIVVVILVFVGIFALTGKNSQTSGKSGSVGTLTQHVEGSGSTGVTLVEYGDYECPFCGQYFPTVKQVQSEFNDQIKFQFRNFPLVSIHQNAFAGARAAEAAAMQNKFWEMHDLLYEENELSQTNPNATTWIKAGDPTPFFNQYAQQLGLNLTKFKADYGSGQVNNLINADLAEGNKLNVQGTPTFFLDGKQVQIGNTVGAFETLIKAEIAKKTTGSQAPAPANTGTTSQTKAKSN